VAVWQFTVALIPQGWIESGGIVGNLFGEQGFEPASAWLAYDDSRIEESIDAVLPQGKSWHPDLKFWGNVTTDDIQMFRVRGRVESMRIRFDLRNPNIRLFHDTVRLAQDLRLAIVSLSMRRSIPLDMSQLLRAAAESDAAHFAMDPESFLLQAAAQNDRAT
jgi:hypothetical protein